MRGVDLLQLLAGVAGQFAGAQQQAVDHIGIELLAGATLLPRDFGSVQQLDQGGGRSGLAYRRPNNSKAKEKRLQRILANPHAPSAKARADDAFSMMS
ncbi:Uncharacterised protein [Stenotrophomonas maltophilia]|nr:Uncharacterised protein [Stenotrophomonas maltophilia]